MYLIEKSTGHLLEIVDLKALFDPFETTVPSRAHYGEEIQPPEDIAKAVLAFPSGESLPRCWIDPHYRNEKIRHA